jgi:hypothetical protein
MVIKKCGGFFFLFFLNGFSIGNGQQGISYNGSRLGEVGDFENENAQIITKLKLKYRC